MRAHLDTATTGGEATQGPDREPSSARSAFDCAGSVESDCARPCIRGRCEPRTARGPVAVSRCAPAMLTIVGPPVASAAEPQPRPGIAAKEHKDHKGEFPIPDCNRRHLLFVPFVFSPGSNFFAKLTEFYLLQSSARAVACGGALRTGRALPWRELLQGWSLVPL